MKKLKRQNSSTNLLTKTIPCHFLYLFLLHLSWISCPLDKLYTWGYPNFLTSINSSIKIHHIWTHIISTSRYYKTYFVRSSVNIEIASSECFCLAEIGKHHLLNSTVIFARECIYTFENETFLRQLDRCRCKWGICVTENQKRLINNRGKNLCLWDQKMVVWDMQNDAVINSLGYFLEF